MNLADIKKIRDMTGVGLSAAKEALAEAGGDFETALQNMRLKGLTKVAKRADRETSAGIVDCYLHDHRIGVVLEVNCETDFVAQNQKFRDFVHAVALQIAASNPSYVATEDIPEEVLNSETEIFKKQALDRKVSPEKLDLVIGGQIKKFQAEVCLLEQAYIKDNKQTVNDLLQAASAQLGEKLAIRRFQRFELGDSSN